MLSKLDQYLRSAGLGFVKAAISVTSIYHSKAIEPYALDFGKRLDVLKGLKWDGLSVSATIKPILPFVEDAEYIELIQMLLTVTGSIVTGGLYYHPQSDFAKDYKLTNFASTAHAPGWLAHDPGWAYIDPSERVDRWQAWLHSQGNSIQLYRSDLDAIAHAIAFEQGEEQASNYMVPL